MSETTRRTFVKQCLGAAVAWQAAGRLARPAAGDTAGFDLEVVGKIKPRRSCSILASPLSVGFETLDRRMFDPNGTYRLLADLGAKWARTQTGWSRTEQSKGEYDFAWLDEVVDSLRTAGVEPWFNLGYGNRLYSPDAPDASAVGWAPLATDEARQAWGRYVCQMARHFRDRVTRWEIWNEPNIRTFWRPGAADPKAYVELVKMTAPEIRKQVPGAVIIGGALAGIPLTYLEGCMDAGMGDLVDKVSYHPYRAVPEANYDDDVAKLRKLLARYKPDLAIWQGECGCPSAPGSSGALGGFGWSERAQAKWVLRRLLTDLSLKIELTSYFHTVDLVNYNWGLGPSGKTNFKGLLRGTDYSPKPSYFAYQCLAALFDAETTSAEFGKAASIQTHPDSNPLVEADLIQRAGFVRRGRAMFAYWLPSSPLVDFAPRKISLSLSAAGDGELPVRLLKEPVLIDPMTSQVFALDRAEKNDDTWNLGSVPLVDYPLIVADRALTGGGSPDGESEEKKSGGGEHAVKDEG